MMLSCTHSIHLTKSNYTCISIFLMECHKGLQSPTDQIRSERSALLTSFQRYSLGSWLCLSGDNVLCLAQDRVWLCSVWYSDGHVWQPLSLHGMSVYEPQVGTAWAALSIAPEGGLFPGPYIIRSLDGDIWGTIWDEQANKTCFVKHNPITIPAPSLRFILLV